MAPDPRSPVIVGVGQHLQRADGLDDALSPVDLIVEAVRAAAADTGAANVLSHAQSLRVVQLLSWRYRDPAALVAARLGIQPAETAYTTAGGNTPQSLVNLTASEILDGSIDCAVLMGGEAWRTRMRARRTDAVLAWDKQADEVEPDAAHRLRDEDEPPVRARARRRDAGAGVPDVRDRAAGPSRRGGRRITRCARPSCGPASATSRQPIRTRGCATRSPPRRSARRRRATG